MTEKEDKRGLHVMEFITAESIGWTRYPQRDTPSFEVWERPDGRLYAVPRGEVLRFAVTVNDFPAFKDRMDVPFEEFMRGNRNEGDN